jgi:hypothetical protein
MNVTIPAPRFNGSDRALYCVYGAGIRGCEYRPSKQAATSAGFLEPTLVGEEKRLNRLGAIFAGKIVAWRDARLLQQI